MTSPTPYAVPTAPTGTALILRSRVVESGDVELRAAAVGDTGTYHPRTPLQFFSAFDAGGRHLGTWSPGYPGGWDWVAGVGGCGLGSRPGAAACTAIWVVANDARMTAALNAGRTALTFDRS